MKKTVQTAENVRELFVLEVILGKVIFRHFLNQQNLEVESYKQKKYFFNKDCIEVK